jgi:hypothetical protein
MSPSAYLNYKYFKMIECNRLLDIAEKNFKNDATIEQGIYTLKKIDHQYLCFKGIEFRKKIIEDFSKNNSLENIKKNALESIKKSR